MHSDRGDAPVIPSSEEDEHHSHLGMSPVDVKNKEEQIEIACQGLELGVLRQLAESRGGLLTNEGRRKAWPILLGMNSTDSLSSTDYSKSEQCEDWTELPTHRDESQVRLDVDRSFIYYPPAQSSSQSLARKGELLALITEILRRHPFLCYFQGYHDICQVLFLVLPPETRCLAAARLSLLQIRDFMLPTLDGALAQLTLIPSIIYAVKPTLYQHLSQTQPYFALSDTLTMYAHNIESFGEISRLFDVFLAKEAVFPVYMFAQIVLCREAELFAIPADEPEILHSVLSKLPRSLNVEELISKTTLLMQAHPPETLRVWSNIDRYSVLKTTHSAEMAVKQSLQDGEQYFYAHLRHMRLIEQRKKIFQLVWKYKRPITTLASAFAVAVLAYWLRRGTKPSWASLFGIQDWFR